ncbi:hypothetical protein ACFRFL_26595 [Streptomyces sp. NPDC056708]|uniref:hypothetical protein n=1 Tax=unclassified Streptomyces TaxID=2593676 RepID=UPI0036A5F13E
MGEGAASGAFESKAEEGVDAERRRLTTTPEAEVPDTATPLTIAGEVVTPTRPRPPGIRLRGVTRTDLDGRQDVPHLVRTVRVLDPLRQQLRGPAAHLLGRDARRGDRQRQQVEGAESSMPASSI